MFARDIANDRSDVMTPAEVEAAARTVAGAHGLTLTVLEGDALIAHGLRLFHAVGQAAT